LSIQEQFWHLGCTANGQPCAYGVGDALPKLLFWQAWRPRRRASGVRTRAPRGSPVEPLV